MARTGGGAWAAPKATLLKSRPISTGPCWVPPLTVFSHIPDARPDGFGLPPPAAPAPAGNPRQRRTWPAAPPRALRPSLDRPGLAETQPTAHRPQAPVRPRLHHRWWLPCGGMGGVPRRPRRPTAALPSPSPAPLAMASSTAPIVIGSIKSSPVRVSDQLSGIVSGASNTILILGDSAHSPLALAGWLIHATDSSRSSVKHGYTQQAWGIHRQDRQLDKSREWKGSSGADPSRIK